MSANPNTKTLALSGHTYEIARFDARTGMGVRARLLKVVGPILAPLAGAKGGGKLGEVELSADLINSIGRALSQNLDADDVARLVDQLMEVVIIDKNATPGFWAAHFAGNYADLDMVLLEVVQHNGFFGQLGKAGSLSL